MRKPYMDLKYIRRNGKWVKVDEDVSLVPPSPSEINYEESVRFDDFKTKKGLVYIPTNEERLEHLDWCSTGWRADGKK